MGREHPPVILVVLDTLRSDRVSCYGYDRETTPNLDAFAKRATRYDEAVAQSNWSVPSHASMFTGKYPHQHGATSIAPVLRKETTLGDQLQEEGYRTIGISSNHFIRPFLGFGKGFDRFHTPHPITEPKMIASLLGGGINAAMSSSRLRRPLQKLYNQLCMRYDNRPHSYADAEEGWTWRKAKKVLETLDEQFFLFANFFEAHLPRAPLQRFHDELVDDDLADVPVPTNDRAYNFSTDEMDERQLRKMRQLYDADIRTLDHQFGMFIDALKERGMYEDSLIIVVSDHGENLGACGLIGHQYSMFDSVTGVPLLIKYPGQEQGRVVSEQVETRRIYDTVLDGVGIRPDAGRSLRYVDESGPAYSEYHTPMLDIPTLIEEHRTRYRPELMGRTVSFVRHEDVKLIDYHGKEQLYELPDHVGGQIPVDSEAALAARLREQVPATAR